MSETHFDRSDWRPGKRRRTQPRVHDYGGQKEAPVNLLAMAKLVGLHQPRQAVHSHCNLDRKSVSPRRDERFEPVSVAWRRGRSKEASSPRAQGEGPKRIGAARGTRQSVEVTFRNGYYMSDLAPLAQKSSNLDGCRRPADRWTVYLA